MFNSNNSDDNEQSLLTSTSPTVLDDNDKHTSVPAD